MATEAGIRARKKQRTREAIVEAALRLFAERGFDGTTIADIAAAADIAPRTFFGYFATKEDVVFHDAAAVKASLVERLADRPPGETTDVALRAWIESVIDSDAAEPERMAEHRRLIESSAALAARDRLLTSQFEAVLADAIAADLGESPSALRPRLAAAATTAALAAIEQYDAEHGDQAGRMQIVDDALAFVGAGIAALRDR